MTVRQRAYMPALGQRYGYTPQMVIDGRYQEVGSDEAAIKRLVERLASSDSPKLGISLIAEEGNRVTLRIPARPYSGEAAVWLIAARAPSSVAPLLRRMIGLPSLRARAAAARSRGPSRTDSM